jgi:hypothetical protein
MNRKSTVPGAGLASWPSWRRSSIRARPGLDQREVALALGVGLGVVADDAAAAVGERERDRRPRRAGPQLDDRAAAAGERDQLHGVRRPGRDDRRIAVAG